MNWPPKFRVEVIFEWALTVVSPNYNTYSTAKLFFEAKTDHKTPWKRQRGQRFYALIGGIISISHGPMYAWYGMLQDMRSRGLKEFVISPPFTSVPESALKVVRRIE
ncbi:hypothetical protein HRM2_39170 [Desulforapulum autotrophicum HRM2]|uniref:Uncharacterized protein n=1 Tax=Desulforapulum autotrophicum (strain ATCC 43914 / DSM 3382 / VKM B-1955 / HRM2) TaxID=177437 RepID=C0QBH3_DESAH|nr:hypothetical protein [Desulforapulum autotrophicum]ACN16975.1 hypothetical protein HRM2_39170 [Desulforapulum autotrophicum HRM2]